MKVLVLMLKDWLLGWAWLGAFGCPWSLGRLAWLGGGGLGGLPWGLGWFPGCGCWGCCSTIILVKLS